MKVQGKASFVIKEKLKGLRERLKIWNKEVFGIMDLEVDRAVKNLNQLGHLASISCTRLTLNYWLIRRLFHLGFGSQ